MDRPPTPGEAVNVLILGTAEWNSPIATNQHYVTRELARTADVTFVESLGLRTPTLSRDDLARMASRAGRAFGRGASPANTHVRPRPDRAKVVSPLVIPLHRKPTRRVNTALLRRATADWLGAPRPRVLWTFTPVTYGLEAAADVVIYHCVDLLEQFPGIDATAVQRGEQRLASRADIAIATSKAVEKHLEARGFSNLILLPNVADVSVFNAASRPAAERRRAALFAGNLSVHKLDLDLLEALAKAVAGHGELLLAGPLGAGGGGFGLQLKHLESLGAKHLGVLTPERLAEVAGRCDVGLIPYAINDYTRGISPLKCFEYLASGVSVLSTGLASVAGVAAHNPYVTVADPAEMPDHLLRLMRPVSDEVIEDRKSSAAAHGWQGRGEQLRDLMISLLHSPGSPIRMPR